MKRSDGESNKQFLADVEIKVANQLAVIGRGRTYLAKEILGAEFWQPLTNGQRRLAGIHISRLVDDRTIPLRFVGKTSENKMQYQLQ